MPVPKYRTSASKRNMRRSHHFLRSPGLSSCSNCGETKQPHTVCKACGFYNGKQVMEASQSSSSWDGSGLDSTES